MPIIFTRLIELTFCRSFVHFSTENTCSLSSLLDSVDSSVAQHVNCNCDIFTLLNCEELFFQFLGNHTIRHGMDSELFKINFEFEKIHQDFANLGIVGIGIVENEFIILLSADYAEKRRCCGKYSDKEYIRCQWLIRSHLCAANT